MLGSGLALRPPPNICNTVSSLTGARCKRDAHSAEQRMDGVLPGIGQLAGWLCGGIRDSQPRKSLGPSSGSRWGEDERSSEEANSLVRSHTNEGSTFVVCAELVGNDMKVTAAVTRYGC